MRVVVFVAAQAIRLQRDSENRLDVAGRTFSVGMSPVQGMTGIDRVIELHGRPAGRHVAGVALASEVAVVLVVVLMAGDTVHRQGIGEGVVTVACVTALLAMFAKQREARITFVIEACVFPAHRAMAVTALVSAAAVVRIVLRVAVVAGSRCICKCVIGMTVQALGPLMLPDQRVPGRIVVKLEVHPVVWCVAIAALIAKGLTVWVICFVTGIAI